MKNMKREVLICISAKLADPAGICVWRLCDALDLLAHTSSKEDSRKGLLVCLEHTRNTLETVLERIRKLSRACHVGDHQTCCSLV